jgi:hypothetical protein
MPVSNPCVPILRPRMAALSCRCLARRAARAWCVVALTGVTEPAVSAASTSRAARGSCVVVQTAVAGSARWAACALRPARLRHVGRVRWHLHVRLLLHAQLRRRRLRDVRRVRRYMHVRLLVHTQLRWRRMRHIRRVRRNVRQRLLLLPELWSVRLRGVRRVRWHLQRRLLARQRQLQGSKAARLGQHRLVESFVASQPTHGLLDPTFCLLDEFAHFLPPLDCVKLSATYNCSFQASDLMRANPGSCLGR